MRRTSSSSVSSVQISGPAFMARYTVVVPKLPPLRTVASMTSRNVRMPTTRSCDITTSEPMSFWAITAAASARLSSGVMVYRALPLRARMSRTFMGLEASACGRRGAVCG